MLLRRVNCLAGKLDLKMYSSKGKFMAFKRRFECENVTYDYNVRSEPSDTDKIMSAWSGFHSVDAKQ